MHFEMIAMEVTDPHHAPRKLGRPLSFNRDMALRQAMLTFWRYGYETASVADLTAAMGISAPSLYAAFGDKRRLFLEAMRLYAGDANLASAALDVAPTSRDAARELMIGAAIAYTGEDTPKGCLLASATASGSAACADVQQAVADVRRGVEFSLRTRIGRDIVEGVLPPGTSVVALAGLVMSVTQGMSVLARDGAPREVLLSIVTTVLAAWPASPRC
jgi:AcrR family transcriptional regulator